MIVHGRRRGGRIGFRRLPQKPEPDPLVEAIREAQTAEAYLDLFRKTLRVLDR